MIIQECLIFNYYLILISIVKISYFSIGIDLHFNFASILLIIMNFNLNNYLTFFNNFEVYNERKQVIGLINLFLRNLYCYCYYQFTIKYKFKDFHGLFKNLIIAFTMKK